MPRKARKSIFFGVLLSLVSIYAKNETFYAILGCNVTDPCTVKDFKRNYRRLALEYHPDKIRSAFEGKVTEEEMNVFREKFLSIKNAYETLIDPERK
jgi:DnaJ-class molecular chaperone